MFLGAKKEWGAIFEGNTALQISLHVNRSNWIISSKDVKVCLFDLAISYFYTNSLTVCSFVCYSCINPSKFDPVIVQQDEIH